MRSHQSRRAKAGQRLVLMDLPEPQLPSGQVLVRVAACAVCRTEANEALARLREGRLQGAAVLVP